MLDCTPDTAPPPPPPIQLTFDEMKDYFTLVGASLTDDEFSTILTEMTDSAATASLLKAAAQ